MKIGFIGLGNMADAMIGGLLKKGHEKNDIIGSAKSDKTREAKAAKYGIRTDFSNKEIAELSDVIVLAVKPVFLPDVLADIAEVVVDDATGAGEKIILSIAAGKSLEWLEKGITDGYKDNTGKESNVTGKIKIVRAMPNTPALVMEAITAVCANAAVSEEEADKCLELTKSFGKASFVPERLFDAVTGVSGSSPAYVFLFIEALADGAVAAGMPRAQAYEFAAQSVLGSAKLMLETGKHPGELKDMVCSPAGTTIEAVKVLEECGLRGAVMDAVEACVEKSKSM